MKLAIALFLCLALSSCTSQKKVMASWMGNSKQNLIMSWGPPASSTSDGGTGEILVYAQPVYIPQYNMNYYNYRMFYVDRRGTIYHWLTRQERVPPTEINLNVYKRF